MPLVVHLALPMRRRRGGHLFWQQLRQHQQVVALFRRLREAPKEVPNAAPKEVSEEAERQAHKEAPQRHCPTLDLFSLMCVGLHVNLILVTLFAQFLHFFCILAHTVHSWHIPFKFLAHSIPLHIYCKFLKINMSYTTSMNILVPYLFLAHPCNYFFCIVM